MSASKHYDTIIKPVITEKATLLAEQNKVVFQVPLTATKPAATSMSGMDRSTVRCCPTLANNTM